MSALDDALNSIVGVIPIIIVAIVGGAAVTYVTAMFRDGEYPGPSSVLKQMLPLSVIMVIAAMLLMIAGAALSNVSNVSLYVNDSMSPYYHPMNVVNMTARPDFDYSGLRNDICLKEMQVLNIRKIYSNKTAAEQKRIAMTKEWEALVSRYNQHATEDKVGLFDGCSG
jgi:hypothetical protein